MIVPASSPAASKRSSGDQHNRVAGLAERQIGELSGGQQQRVLLARALVQEAGLLLLDELLNAVDQTQRQAVDGVLAEQAAAGVAVVAATHDLDWLARSFDRAVYLDQGRIVRIVRLRPQNSGHLLSIPIRACGRADWPA